MTRPDALTVVTLLLGIVVGYMLYLLLPWFVGQGFVGLDVRGNAMLILRTGQVLAIAAFVLVLAAAAGRAPLWIAVLLLALLACLKTLPLP